MRFDFQMIVTSELKLQIQVMLRIINMVYFLLKSCRNQKEFDAMSWFTKIHYGAK